jgi:hypothetical protein
MPDDGGSSPRRRKLIVGLAAVLLAVPAAGLAYAGVATASESSGPDEVITEETTSDDQLPQCGPEEIAEVQADEDALAAFFDERGIVYWRVESDGVTWVMWDPNDAAANQAEQEFWDTNYPATPDEVSVTDQEAAELDAQVEETTIERSYSVTRGWFGDDGACELSVTVD